ncbi:hypothetical protein ES703_113266 [subsurface metagenome]
MAVNAEVQILFLAQILGDFVQGTLRVLVQIDLAGGKQDLALHDDKVAFGTLLDRNAAEGLHELLKFLTLLLEHVLLFLERVNDVPHAKRFLLGIFQALPEFVAVGSQHFDVAL